MKKFLSLLLGSVMLVSMLAACGGNTSSAKEEPAGGEPAAQEPATQEENEPEEPDAGGGTGDLIVVGYAQVGAESDWRTANTASFQSFFVPENGYELIFNDAQQDQNNQIKAIRDFIAQEVDYIVLAPTTETGWETVLQEAKDAGIPVILSDRMVEVTDDSLFEAWVGGDFLYEGQKAMTWLEGYLKELGRDDEEINIIHLQGTMGSSPQLGRTQGIKEGVEANENFVILEGQTGEFTQAKGQEVMEAMLKSYDKIDVVIAENDNMAFGAIDAIRAAGLVPGEDIIIIGMDAVGEAFKRIIAGEMNCTVECNPLHAPRVGEIIQKLEAGEPVEKLQYPEEGVFDAKNAEEIFPERAY